MHHPAAAEAVEGFASAAHMRSQIAAAPRWQQWTQTREADAGGGGAMTVEYAMFPKMARWSLQTLAVLVAFLGASFMTACLVNVPELLDGPADATGDGQADALTDAGGEEVDVVGGDEAAPAADSPACGGSWLDCDGDMSNGCEDTTSDPDHCGSCGHGCLGGTCDGGRCQPVLLASGIRRPFGLVVDADFVYGTGDSDTGHVFKVPVNGCESPGNCAALLSTVGAKYQDIAIDEEAIFFAERSAGRVLRINKTGSAQCEIATNQGSPVGVAVDDEYVYWTARTDGKVLRAAKICGGGGVPEVLAATTLRPQMLALDATGLYWTSEAGGLVSWASTDGANTRTIWAGVGAGNYMFGIATDDTWVYWRDGYIQTTELGPTGRLARARKDGSGGFEVLAEQQNEPRYLALDEDYAYWGADKEVLRIAKDAGATPEVLAQGVRGVHGVVVDTMAVYFCEFYLGNLYRIAK